MASVPENARVYAVGDIHGRLDLLDRLHALIDEDSSKNDPPERMVIVYLGDYVDRGPDSKGVVEKLRRMMEGEDPTLAAFEKVALRGNHEQSMLDVIRGDRRWLDAWVKWGGFDTAKSYGMDLEYPGSDAIMRIGEEFHTYVDDAHVGWISRLPYFHIEGDFFFVHAGVIPGDNLTTQENQVYLWVREEFLQYKGDFGKVIVHGHTPTPGVPDLNENRIGIDTGAVWTETLTAVGIQGNQVWFLQT